MDRQEFIAEMKRFGDTQTILAAAMGISRTRLNAKINEKDNASFTQPEIAFIRNRYNLSAADIEKIFFAKKYLN